MNETTRSISFETTQTQQAIVCSLSGSDFAEREATWRAVTARALRDRRPIADGVRLEFEAHHEVAHVLAELVHAERECCPWASWTLIDGSASAAVEVTAAGAGADAVRRLFGLD